jgi:hypothetical protein
MRLRQIFSFLPPPNFSALALAGVRTKKFAEGGIKYK